MGRIKKTKNVSVALSTRERRFGWYPRGSWLSDSGLKQQSLAAGGDPNHLHNTTHAVPRSPDPACCGGKRFNPKTPQNMKEFSSQSRPQMTFCSLFWPQASEFSRLYSFWCTHFPVLQFSLENPFNTLLNGHKDKMTGVETVSLTCSDVFVFVTAVQIFFFNESFYFHQTVFNYDALKTNKDRIKIVHNTPKERKKGNFSQHFCAKLIQNNRVALPFIFIYNTLYYCSFIF